MRDLLTPQNGYWLFFRYPIRVEPSGTPHVDTSMAYYSTGPEFTFVIIAWQRNPAPQAYLFQWFKMEDNILIKKKDHNLNLNTFCTYN